MVINPFDSDGWLVHRTLTGNQSAFGRLYDRHSRRIYNLLCRLCRGNRTEAEDLAQDTFLAAFQALRNWRGEGAFSTWLCGIAYRQYANARRDTHPTEPLDEEWSDGGVHADPLAHYTHQENQQVMEAAVAALPDLPREVFVLVRIEGFRYKEVALLLQIPVGTVQSRLWRATQTLQSQLATQIGEHNPVTETIPQPGNDICSSKGSINALR